MKTHPTQEEIKRFDAESAAMTSELIGRILFRSTGRDYGATRQDLLDLVRLATTVGIKFGQDDIQRSTEG